jgi:EmrB/QacA subfamily drug resistance transporter
MLAVLSLSLLIIEGDATILNVALPTFQREFDASASAMQWLVDSYIVVFAGLLLFMGALGDRFGRKRALQAGLVIFGAASLAATQAGSMNQLIATRVIMGVGAALIMPATLAIIVNVFPRGERVKAIAAWSAVAILGVALGPVLGGWLLSQFWWGSIFLVAVPIAAVALLAGAWLVPESKNPAASALDRVGALLSIGALALVVYAIIEAPERGLLDPSVAGTFAAALAFGTAFVLYELRATQPLLDVRLFRNWNMSVAVGSIVLLFGAMVGMGFLLIQYLQFALGYSPLQAGLRVIPVAFGYVVGATVTDRLVGRFGARRLMTGGLLVVAAAFVGMSFAIGDQTYWALAIAMAVLGIGIAQVMTPATAAVMGAVPGANVGVGSALNDTARQIGAALGVAALGSLAKAIYSSEVSVPAAIPPEFADSARDSIGIADQIAESVGGPAGEALREAANAAFFDAFGWAMLVAALAAFVTAALVGHFMPDSEATNVEERASLSAGPKLAEVIAE